MSDAAIVYRVITMPDSLLNMMREERDRRKATNVQFLSIVVNEHLPTLVAALKTLGFQTLNDKKRTVRLPFSDEDATLGQLREACEETGLPATKLLELCLVTATRSSAATKPRRRRRRSKSDGATIKRPGRPKRKRRTQK